MSGELQILRVRGDRLCPSLVTQIEAIFFATSLRVYAPGPERDAFRERWLGRYLASGTDIVLLALQAGGRLAGYLVGAVENPAEQARFADIGYLRSDFAELCRCFPAHLHINLAEEFRCLGLGGKMVEAFAAAASAAGAIGMHVVTGEGMRNVGFYRRCGFAERGRAVWTGRRVLFLARRLAHGSGRAPTAAGQHRGR
jgi:GNAT superfamily N-acetyltransferase